MPPKAAKAKAHGKAAAGASKVAAKAKTAPAPPDPPRAAAPAAPAPAAKLSPEEAESLSAKAAEDLLAGISPEDLAALADTTDELEQLPARQALEYVGDRDLTWENAQKSLRNGGQFLKDMLEMQAGEFITKQSFQRFQELGSTDIFALWEKNRAAYLLAVFLQACLREARDRLGLPAAPPPPPPLPAEPPAWPLLIDFKDKGLCTDNRCRQYVRRTEGGRIE